LRDPHSKGFRRGRPPRGPPRGERVRGVRPPAKPMPLGDKCNPLCPFFKCSKNALVVVNRVVRGHVQKAAMCRWIGDQCLGSSCQFAFCERRALLPDGKCAFAVKFKESGDEYLKEVEKETLGEEVYDIMEKRVGRRETFLE